MPRSDWRTIYAIGLIAALTIFAVVVGAVIYRDADHLQRSYERSANDKARDYARRADINSERRCLRIAAPEAKQNCIREEAQAAREGQHDEYDLQAQLVTSAWTRAMGIAAIVGMTFGIVGVGLVFITFREARHGNDIARDALEGQLRPWIEFRVSKAGTLEIVDDRLELVLAVTFKNIGTSPAIDLTYMGTMIFGTAIDPHFRKLVERFRTSDHDWADKNLFPDGTWERNVVAVHNGPRSGTEEMTFVIVARYRTPFSETYRFTARAFDVGPTVSNSMGEMVPVGHRLFDMENLPARQAVLVIEKQHFSGFAT